MAHATIYFSVASRLRARRGRRELDRDESPPGRAPAIRRAVPFVACAVAATFGGCAVGPDFVEPAAPEGAGYARKLSKSVTDSQTPGGAGQRFELGRDVPGEWWKLFRSKQISALVEEAVQNHPNIASAEAALRQARETLEADAASFLPSATGTSGVTRQQLSPAQYGSSGSSSSFSTLYTLFNSNVAVSFTPDVFGKTIRTVEGDAAAAEYQRYQLEATYLALTANVISAAISDASYAKQIKVTEGLVSDYRAQLDILQKRFDLGAVSLADVTSERTLLAQAEATLPPLQKARAQTRNQLMAYLGRFPNEDKGEAIDLENLHLPKDLPLSLPSKLVRQRPDILAAESQLHQASANIGVATANMLPQLTLSASGGSQALTAAQLFTPQTMAYSLGASVSGQLFDGGGLFHKREARVAAFEQATAQYQGTVLTAFQNVADALQAIKHDAATLRAQVAAEKAAAESFQIAQVQYRAGSTTYPTVINSEQSLLNARLNRVKAQAARFSDTVALLQALGGGWWNRNDETPAARAKPTDPISMSPIAAALRAQAEESTNAH
ncbi:efflux transporter outer membrane subunit [Methylocystis sp. JR02]|uniref:efflux transporter outer membrane subunit n=1 Tax=Methylocystis sp. JR02 TaxID=3046284 RepID=UPI0024B92FDE|nr:efflux transporter outer membrane subunit [Methylocystis sp. JR02]MDJ0447267.1 efflux transporter outer membrane subunit [Methylocystis sp. JR02]